MNDLDRQKSILDAIIAERERQDAKWGQQDHIASVWGCIIGEEAGEVCKAINEYGFAPTSENIDAVFIESVQTAACCVALCEHILRVRRDSVEDYLEKLGFDPAKRYEIPQDVGEAALMSVKAFERKAVGGSD